jgi:hypothetical protein
MIIAYGPSYIKESLIGGFFSRKIIRGTKNAADLPEPVGARAIISRI